MFDHIEIPKELLPKDGRFGCGPSLVRPEFVEELAREAKTYLGTSHRQAKVKDKVGSAFQLLRQYYSVPADYKIAMGNGSASIVWDMMVFGLIEKKSVHYSNGEFSSKSFASTQGANWIEAKQIKVENGTVPNFVEHEGYDVHCLAWNETSTGAMYPNTPTVKNSLLAIDATSAIGALK